MISHKFNLIFLISILLLTSCNRKKNRLIKKINVSKIQHKFENNQKEPDITIWVHGTCLFPRLFLNHYFNSDPGLIKAEDVNPNYYLKTIADVISVADPVKFPYETFYIFGWKGGLDCKERQEASHDLFKNLLEIVRNYKNKYKVLPKINIIAHSHGGNVVLNLNKIKNEDIEFCINKLILLACPVQKETKDYLKSNFFKKVYSFYSTLDIFQVLDPQGFHKVQRRGHKKRKPLFSERKFESSDNLIQVQIKLNGRGLFHSEFLTEKFLKVLPNVLDEIDNFNDNFSEYLLNICT